jgi:ABC-type polysaccharide/polyol phosphate transport system ATPase subunit
METPGIVAAETGAGRHVAVSVSRLSKAFKVYNRPADVLRELLLRRPCHTLAWALREISFDIERGEIVGLIGANGAGKSTLLRILSGVLDASAGTFHVAGNLRAILELGTGFQDHYTGLENVYVGGACLGYSRRQINESLDWIIDFAELRPVIHRPFRTYSSGMRARLTFAVTFCRRPEIMIVDEALAVGDVGFAAKCVNRIIELCASGSTALVVSHNMFFIERLCSRVLYLKDGLLIGDGPPQRLCQRFEAELLGRFSEEQKAARRSEAMVSQDAPASASPGEAAAQTARESEAVVQLLADPEGKCPVVLPLRLVRLVRVVVLDRDGQERARFHTGEPLAIRITVDSDVHKDNVVVGVQVFHETGIHVLTSTNRWHIAPNGRPRCVALDLRKGRQTFTVRFPALFLADGKYYVSVGLSPKDVHFSALDLLMQEQRVAVFGFYRDDVSWKVLYDPPSEWAADAGAATGTAGGKRKGHSYVGPTTKALRPPR